MSTQILLSLQQQQERNTAVYGFYILAIKVVLYSL